MSAALACAAVRPLNTCAQRNLLIDSTCCRLSQSQSLQVLPQSTMALARTHASRTYSLTGTSTQPALLGTRSKPPNGKLLRAWQLQGFHSKGTTGLLPHLSGMHMAISLTSHLPHHEHLCQACAPCLLQIALSALSAATDLQARGLSPCQATAVAPARAVRAESSVHAAPSSAAAAAAAPPATPAG